MACAYSACLAQCRFCSSVVSLLACAYSACLAQCRFCSTVVSLLACAYSACLAQCRFCSTVVSLLACAYSACLAQCRFCSIESFHVHTNNDKSPTSLIEAHELRRSFMTVNVYVVSRSCMCACNLRLVK